MTRHLGSRYTRASDMAEALYWAIDEAGLRLPPRRDIARRAGVSEATISRRFRESGGDEEDLVSRLVRARRSTYPPGYISDGLSRWLPEEAVDIQDVRVWLSCLARAAYSTELAEVVTDAWRDERELLSMQLGSTDSVSEPEHEPEHEPEQEGVREEILQAVVLGLCIRRALDPGMEHGRAVEVLARALSGLA